MIEDPMKFALTRILVAFLALSATACDEDDDDGTGIENQFAHLRVVNAADIADVSVRFAGAANPFVQDLDFREVTTTCYQVPPLPRTLTFSAGADLATTSFTFVAGESYTAFLVSSNGVHRALVLPDTTTASAGNNALRFINGTTAPGDVYVTPTGGALSAAFLAAGNMGVLAQSNALPSYVHRSTQHTQVRLFNTGTTAAPRADIELSGLAPGMAATVVFVNAGTPAGPTAFLVTPCP
jgi:hypothetical protein